MNPLVQLKLLENVGKFAGLKLKYGQFKTYKIKGKDILTLELIFNTFDPYESEGTMVLALDKGLTEGDYKEIAEKIVS